MDQLGTHDEVMRLVAMEEERRFGRTLSAVMGALEVTDRWLAERLGTSRQSIHQKKRGATPIRLAELPAMADALGVPVDVFYIDDVSAALRAATEWLAFDDDEGRLVGTYYPNGDRVRTLPIDGERERILRNKAWAPMTIAA